MQKIPYNVEITLTGTDGERVPLSVDFHAKSDKQAAIKAMALAEGVAQSGSWPPSVQGYLCRRDGGKVGSFSNTGGASLSAKCSFSWAGLSASGVAVAARNMARNSGLNPVDLLAYTLLQVLKSGCDGGEPTAAGVAALLEENLAKMSTF